MNCLRISLGSSSLEISANSDITATDVEQAFSILARLKNQMNFKNNSLDEIASAEGDADSSQYNVGINTFVSTLGGGSCRALLKTAALHLALADGLATFSKDQWFERAAQAHEWQKDFGNQRARDVKRLISSKEIIEKPGNLFAASSKLIAEAKSKLNEK